MVWIESHQEIGQHPKTKRLARALGVSVPTAVGHLHLLWHWAMAFAQDGDLSSYEAWEFAEGALWDGDAAVFVGALQGSGFLDGDVRLHDWHEYAGKLIERRRLDAERKRALRRPADMAGTGGGVAGDGRVMAGGRDADDGRVADGGPADGGGTAEVTVPYPTRPNLTGDAPPVGSPLGAAAPVTATGALPSPTTDLAADTPENLTADTATDVPDTADTSAANTGDGRATAESSANSTHSGNRPAKRPRRIGEDFQPSAGMQLWASVELRLDEETIGRETAKFRDHFAGSGKPKLDWEATWRNWMRTVAEGTYGRASGRAMAGVGRDGGQLSPALVRGAPPTVSEIQAELERRRRDRGGDGGMADGGLRIAGTEVGG